MNEVNFVDTTMRDGNLSLWATAITTGMMLPVASQMDRVGFRSVDLIGVGHFKKSVTELRENPWERIRLMSRRMKKTPLSIMMLTSINPFDITPLSTIKLFMEQLAANGMRIVNLMEPSNDMTYRVPEVVQFAKEAGLAVVLALVYSVSPKHTDEYYVQKARDAAKLKIDSIYLKDPGGLLTPERTKTLIPAILGNINGLPFELHSHCTTGLAPLCYLEAIKLGVTTLHTAIPPLANSSSQPSVLNIANNARLLGYTPTIDEEAVKPVAEHFRYIAKREGLPMGTPVEYDIYQLIHQVPGGVMANLKHQLSQRKIGHRLGEVLEEVIKVREDLGYPIQVTPWSQWIGSQAVLNIELGERYKEVTDELIKCALGFWGKEAGSSINPDVKDRILSRHRAKEIEERGIPEPSIEEVRQQVGEPGISDEELLLRLMAGSKEGIKAMHAAGPIKEYISAENPLLALVQELTNRRHLGYIHIQKGCFSLTLDKQRDED